MTILEMIQKNPKRSPSPPESIFEVKTITGDKMLMCMASFLFRPELEEILNKHPKLMEYEVTKETFTQEEVDAYSK